VGLLVWGRPAEGGALRVVVEELDRAGAVVDEGLPEQHEVMDSLDKLRALLTGAGFRGTEAWQVPWRFTPDLEQFLAYRSHRGITGRRFASLDPDAQRRVLERAHQRLQELPPEALHDTSEVLAATAVAP
jgi:hypothetical protein